MLSRIKSISLTSKYNYVPLIGIYLLFGFPEDIPKKFLVFNFFIHLFFIFCNIKKNAHAKKIALVKFVFIGLTLINIKSYFNTFLNVESCITLLYSLLAIKLFELKNKRDIYVYLNIAILASTGNTLFRQDLFITFHSLFFVFFYLSAYSYFSINKHLHQLVNFSKLRYSPKQFLYVLVTFIFLFVTFFTFPRLNLGFGNKRMTGKSGFSPENKPGEVAQVILSDKTIFTASFTQDELPTSQMYWVGSVLDETDGYHWKESHKNTLPVKEISQDNLKEFLNYDILIKDNYSHYLFLLDTPMKITQINERVLKTSEKSFKLRKKMVKKVYYSATSKKNNNSAIIDHGKYNELNRRRYPKVNNQVRQLAKSLKGNNARTTIKNISNYFKKDFSYTLNPGISDNLADFLIESKKGYCSHFASAFSMLARLNNIPSRVIVGFQGASKNNVGQFYEVKEKDAHAWSEVYLANAGWLRIDPVSFVTPDRISLGAERFFQRVENQSSKWSNIWSNFKTIIKINSLTAYIDNINYKWEQFIIQFDQDQQYKLTNLLNISIKTLYLIGPLIFIVSIIVFYFLKLKDRSGIQFDPIQKEINAIIKLIRLKGNIKRPFESNYHFLIHQNEQFFSKYPDMRIALERYHYDPKFSHQESLLKNLLHLKQNLS